MNKNPFTLTYSVHSTPQKPGQQPTYHVRHEQRHVVHTRELQKQVACHHPISQGTFVMVLETLKEELVRLLLCGHGVHIDGLGRFSLQIGIRKTVGALGNRGSQKFDDPAKLLPSEVQIEGITFVPDKAMLRCLTDSITSWKRRQTAYCQDVPPSQLVAVLTDYCRRYGSFTRRTVQYEFGLSRYKASLLLGQLVEGTQPPFVRRRQGTAWVYQLSEYQL